MTFYHRRCHDQVSFDQREITAGYWAVCPTCDEDLDRFETYEIKQGVNKLDQYDKADMIHEFCKGRIQDVIAGYEYEISSWIDQGKTYREAEFLAKNTCFRWVEFQAGIYGDNKASVYRVESYFAMWRLGFPNHLSEVYGSYDGNDGI